MGGSRDGADLPGECGSPSCVSLIRLSNGFLSTHQVLGASCSSRSSSAFLTTSEARRRPAVIQIRLPESLRLEPIPASP